MSTSEISQCKSIEAIAQQASKEGRVIPLQWLPRNDGKGGLSLADLLILVPQLPVTWPAASREVPDTVQVEVSPEVARGIKELNASVGWSDDTPCCEHNIEYFVQLADRISHRADQWQHLQKATALAFLDVYEALAERPFNQAVGPLASLAYLIKDLPGLTEERFGLNDIAETDAQIRALKYRAERGEFKI